MSTEWTAYRLGLLCCDIWGRFSPGAVLVDYAARAALVLDLALRGRLTFNGLGIEIDTTLTGYGPADVLLEHIAAYPHDTMAALFTRAPVTMLDILDPGRTSRRKRPVSPGIDLVDAEHQRAAQPFAKDREPEATATLLLIADTLLLAAGGTNTPIAADCGGAAWLIDDCTTFLTQTRRKFALISTRPDTSG